MALKAQLKVDATFVTETISHIATQVHAAAANVTTEAISSRLQTDSFKEQLAQAAFLKIRAYLESKRDRPIDELRTDLANATVSSTSKAIRGAVKSIVNDGWQNTIAQLASLETWRLFPDSAIARVESMVSPLGNDKTIAAIQKLVSRVNKRFGILKPVS